jgi:hypothetical protein
VLTPCVWVVCFFVVVVFPPFFQGTTNAMCKKITVEGLEVRLGAKSRAPPKGASTLPHSWHDSLDGLLLMKPVHVDGRLRISSEVAEVGDPALSRLDFRFGDIDISCSPHQWDALMRFKEFIQSRLNEPHAAAADDAKPAVPPPVPRSSEPLPNDSEGSEYEIEQQQQPQQQPQQQQQQPVATRGIAPRAGASTARSNANIPSEESAGWLGWMWTALTEDEPLPKPPPASISSAANAFASSPNSFGEEDIPKHSHMGLFVPSIRVRLLELGARGNAPSIPVSIDFGQSAIDVCQRYDPAAGPTTGVVMSVHTASRFQWRHESGVNSPAAAPANPWSEIRGFLFNADSDFEQPEYAASDGSMDAASLRKRALALEEENDRLKLRHTKALSEVEQLRHAMLATGSEALVGTVESSRLRERLFDLQLQLERAEATIETLKSRRRSGNTAKQTGSAASSATEPEQLQQGERVAERITSM